MARRRKHGATESDHLFALRCEVCGRCLVRTSSRYLACPAGHGKLIEGREPELGEIDEQPCGSWFDAD